MNTTLYSLRTPDGRVMDISRRQARRALRQRYTKIVRTDRAPGARFVRFASGCELRMVCNAKGHYA